MPFFIALPKPIEEYELRILEAMLRTFLSVNIWPVNSPADLNTA